MIGSFAPWWIATSRPSRPSSSRRPAVHRRDEAAAHDQAGRRRPPLPQAHRVGHDRAHREAADDGAVPAEAALGEEAVEEPGERLVGRRERLRVRVADARHQVPVAPARRHVRQRRAGSDADEPPLGIELVEEAEEVVLVGAAPVVEDEGALWVALGLADSVDQLAHPAERAARGFWTGVRTRSISSRRSSRNGGRMSDSPRCSGSSSTPKPGSMVAISNSTPLGSRK